MSGDVQVRFREHLKGRFLRVTRLVVMCAGAADAPMATVRHVLERLDLTLNESKTRIVDARQEGFNFLGFSIRMNKSWLTGKSYAHVSPADKSVAKIRDRLKQQTDRRLTPIPLDDVVRNMNASLQGWTGYFHYRNSSKALGKVKAYAEERLRTHLMKRHKIKDRGTAAKRFTRERLYATYGLYKVPITAGWKKAHALA